MSDKVGVNTVTIYGAIIDINRDGVNYLIGKLATLADALIENDRQAKAFKDTLKSIIWENEGRFNVALCAELYACKQRKTPMFCDETEARIKARKDAERGILEQNL